MSLSFAVMVFWSDGMAIQPGALGGLWEPEIFGPSLPGNIGDLSPGCHLATLLAWKQCSGVKTLHGLWTKYMKSLSIALLQNYDTGVSPWYSYKLFCICCSLLEND